MLVVLAWSLLWCLMPANGFPVPLSNSTTTNIVKRNACCRFPPGGDMSECIIKWEGCDSTRPDAQAIHQQSNYGKLHQNEMAELKPFSARLNSLHQALHEITQEISVQSQADAQRPMDEHIPKKDGHSKKGHYHSAAPPPSKELKKLYDAKKDVEKLIVEQSLREAEASKSTDQSYRQRFNPSSPELSSGEMENLLSLQAASKPSSTHTSSMSADPDSSSATSMVAVPSNIDLIPPSSAVETSASPTNAGTPDKDPTDRIKDAERRLQDSHAREAEAKARLAEHKAQEAEGEAKKLEKRAAERPQHPGNYPAAPAGGDATSPPKYIVYDEFPASPPAPGAAHDEALSDQLSYLNPSSETAPLVPADPSEHYSVVDRMQQSNSEIQAGHSRAGNTYGRNRQKVRPKDWLDMDFFRQHLSWDVFRQRAYGIQQPWPQQAKYMPRPDQIHKPLPEYQPKTAKKIISRELESE